MNKTGTSSLRAVFQKIYGMRSNQKKVEEISTIQIIRGNYAPLIEALNNLDFHQDLPVSQGIYYAGLDAVFPKSKFILTIREKEPWFKSIIKQYGRILVDLSSSQPAYKDRYIFRGYGQTWLSYFFADPIDILRSDLQKSDLDPSNLSPSQFSKEFKEACLRVYTQRNQSIIKYFEQRPSDLLIIDISRENNIDKVTNFLNFPPFFSAPFPHVNATNSSNRNDAKASYIDVNFNPKLLIQS